jgi:hypothetical protein
LTIGGILIAGFKVHNIIAKRSHYEMSEAGKRTQDDSFERRLETDNQLYEAINAGEFRLIDCKKTEQSTILNFSAKGRTPRTARNRFHLHSSCIRHLPYRS